MKKLFYLLFLLPLSLFTSCDSEDLSPFNLTLSLSGVTQADNAFYVVAGDNITIESLTVDPVGGKNTQVSNVMFFLDNVPLLASPWNITNPWTFSTANLPVGRHTIGVTGNLLQVDQSIQEFTANYTLEIVGSDADFPEGAPEIGSYSQSISFQ